MGGREECRRTSEVEESKEVVRAHLDVEAVHVDVSDRARLHFLHQHVR